MAKITFYGGAGTVTGANYLFETGDCKIIVDCGLNQGFKYAEAFNYQPFKYNPAEVKYVFITHSHIDHIGRLPKLYKDGFRGVVYMSSAAADLAAVALPDNLNQIEQEARDDGHEPLFKQDDLTGIMSLVKGVHYDTPIDLGDGVSATLHDAGHILGSCIIEINWLEGSDKRRIFFSGDLGNPPTPLLRTTEFVHEADYVLVESAYGDRVHEQREERKQRLKEIVISTIKSNGTLMIPSFATERTQEILFELEELFKAGAIPRVPIYVDSPLAIKLTQVYEKHSDDFNKNAKYIMNTGGDIFKFEGLMMTPSVEESKHINDVPPPKIIIAGSGMSNGGRILHHESRYLPDHNSTLLIIGYQVDGSLGRQLQKGDKLVKIFGKNVPVNCRVVTIGGYSAHADQPALLQWVKEANQGNKLKKVFVVQGEPIAAKALRNLIHDRLGIEAVAPTEGQVVEL